MIDPTQRFSSRVTNYVKYRPSYPAAIIDLLAADCGLTPDAIVADVGSGTGLLSELFLKTGNRVLGIEPNREMRAAGEQLLRGYDRFVSIAAAAEATMLPAHSVDFITAGQSFHPAISPRASRMCSAVCTSVSSPRANRTRALIRCGSCSQVNGASGTRFDVNLVPHTLEMTILGGYRPGTRVNLEVDIIALYLERLVAATG